MLNKALTAKESYPASLPLHSPLNSKKVVVVMLMEE